MSTSIAWRAATIPDHEIGESVKKINDALLTDITALRTSITTLTAKIDVLAAKLNADAGVTDTNYAIDFATVVNPPGLTTIR